MQRPVLKFRQSSIISQKPGYSSENWKLSQAPTTIEFNIFCWNPSHVFYLTRTIKWCLGFFFILFISWVIDKTCFCKCVETRSFFILALASRKRVQNFNKNYKTLWWLKLVKVFSFSVKIHGFFKTIDLCLNFCVGLCIT